ncbi:hypothetical protein WFJ45_22105, partial [Salmonella enterica subsp. enterica serovar Minnesota]|uniref:hypothetical protein n=1 Tax=Salmonella enterica TaxID=28901 RepID=UPI003D2AE56B
IPPKRVRYLAEIAEQGRAANSSVEGQAEAADRAQAYWRALRDLGDPRLPEPLAAFDGADLADAPPSESQAPPSGSEAP